LLSAVGVYFVNGQIEDATRLLEQKSTEGARLAANVKNAAQLPEQLEVLTSAGKKIQSRLIRGSQLATNLQYFYRLETDSGVELIDLRQTSSGQPTKATAGVGFAIAVKGDYVTLLGCLRRLENGPHYCRVMSASINGAAPDRAAPLTLSLSLELLGQP
jgi:hypothetical protein